MKNGLAKKSPLQTHFFILTIRVLFLHFIISSSDRWILAGLIYADFKNEMKM